MMIDQTKKMIIRVYVLAALFLGIVLCVLVPTLLSIKKTSEESYKLRLTLEQKYEQSPRSRLTKQKLEEVKENTARFDEYIFKSGDELRLITFFESLAAKHRLTQTITNANLDNISKDQLTIISLNLTGDYQGLLAYIADLESSNYFIQIEQMQLKPMFAKSGGVAQTAVLDITTKLYVTK